MFEIYRTNWKILCSVWARVHHIGSFPPLSSVSAHRLALAMSLSEERKFILEVIEVYRSLPALWNVKSKDYSNRTKKKNSRMMSY